ncbi:MAG TPA: BON domain-containing protein [Anaerolineae bacterium]|nr:BON domain-containing protein [Anaerolineae bacterium]HIQ05092.1 BON domain-containing protein [Anaerolineae bacterium]
MKPSRRSCNRRPDEEIREEIQQKFYKFNPFRELGEPLGIEVEDGRVRLTGWVRTVSHKQMASRLAGEVDGVEMIHNDILVDDNLEVAAAEALGKDKHMLKNFPGVLVKSFLGHITLSGYVASEEERLRAEELVRGVPGVRGVTNDLIVDAAELARVQGRASFATA